jgi:hypothetical protein
MAKSKETTRKNPQIDAVAVADARRGPRDVSFEVE